MDRMLMLGAALVCALSGCESFNRAVGYRPPPTFEHPAFNSRYSRLDDMQVALHAYALENGEPVDDEEAAVGDDFPSITAENYHARLGSYVNGRLDQVDSVCAVFFHGMERLSANTRWGRDQVNALTDFTAIMMGLTGSAADHLTLLAGFRGLTNDSFEAASTAMLITPDPYRVADLVRLEQSRVEGSFAGRPLDSYREAQRRVRDYARPCTLTGIRSLISESLEDRIQVSQGQQPPPSTLLEPIRDLLNRNAAQGERIDIIPRETLVNLYWLFSLATESEERDHVTSTLNGAMRARVAAAIGDQTTTEGMRDLFRAMDIVQPTLRTQALEAQRSFRVALEAQRAEAAAAAAAAAEGGGQTDQQ